MRYRRTLLSLLVASSSMAGCRALRPIDPHAEARAEQRQSETPKVESARDPERPRDPGSLNDDNIAAMLLALNNTDISYARLVPSRADREDVREFARRMVTDHMGVTGLVNELMTRLRMTPEDNAASLDLRDESAAHRDAMRDLSGFAFDSAYVTNEIRYHRKFLESLDIHMLPRARNSDLKLLLAGVRPAVAAHLAHAEQLWANVMTRR